MYRVTLMDGRVIDVSAGSMQTALAWLARAEGGYVDFLGVEDISGSGEYWTLGKSA